MMEPTYILFEGYRAGEFAFDCVTAAIFDSGTDAVEFS
jgi:hypothetical protein